MAKISKIISREIIDSRGNPTIEAMVWLDDNSVGIYSTPSGLSVGKHEAVELRDNDPKRYEGKGVLNNLVNIGKIIAPAILGKDAHNQQDIDKTLITLDGTDNKSKLGANTILAVSGAVMKAQAISLKIPLYQYVAKAYGINSNEFNIPTPMFNILNGGQHGGGNLDFQEFMVVFPKANTYSLNLKTGIEIYYALKNTIMTHSAGFLLGDEGGYAPTLFSNLDAFKLLEEAISQAGYSLGLDVFFSIDAAATNFKKGGAYKIKDRPVALNANDFIDYYVSLNEQFHFLSIEDPLAEDDWDDWKIIYEKLGKNIQIVGDDLITTNLGRLNKAISAKVCNAVVIKPNQVGTITETFEVIKKAREANFKIIVSHRSGETNDDFIADFAVGIGADYVKFGAPARGERVAKYNRLLEIEHDLS